ncbi:putative kinase [Actinoplanes octamycinicus]|uniref:Putative kinase n=1 Tax=Actinoplanes octamycinicus TaxID=135948 RepID=A0A7W7GZL6_9ACTN|nr:ATP-binding protein [Actinoplanes octamycinicus]MBB4741162.1 putative kinase [Actinoplanes octamycinicus]GIE56069.1 hypothetical protein Aoc01nite_14710 [Actinoplanes octamycinicus]
MMIIERAVVVAVCGSPGAGKTTTARKAAARLGVPLLSRDEIADGLRLSGVAAEAIRGRAETLLVEAAVRFAAAGLSFVLDNSVLSRSLVEGLLGVEARVLAVHVIARDEVIGARLRERVTAGRGGRGDVAGPGLAGGEGEPGSGDTAAPRGGVPTVVRDGDRRLLALFEQGEMPRSIFEPPVGPHAVVELDTSDGSPAVEPIVAAAIALRGNGLR